MRYLLKNFIVFILTCCMTTCVCCANQGTQKAIEKREAFKITVKDHKGVPISGLELKVVGAEHRKATTNGEGVAMFKDYCNTLHGWAEDSEKGRVGIRLRMTDLNKRYKPQTGSLWLYHYDGCEATMSLDESHLNKPQKKYIEAQAMRESIDGVALDGAGNILFYSVCLQKPKLPANVTGKCVDIFKGVNTQYEPAVALAQAYVYEKVGPEHMIECQQTYTTDFNDDYLACTSNHLSHVFEFQFEDLTESFDATIRYDTLEGLCTIYGGEFSFDKDRLYCSKDKWDQTQQLCNKIATVSSRFAISAAFAKNANRCYIDLKAKGSNDTLSTYDGLDPFVFQKYQTKFDNSTKVLIGRYVESKLGSDFRSLQCAYMTKHYSGSRVFDGTYDDIVECTLWVHSKQEPQTIEFVFDDLSELSKTTSQGDKSKMTCLVNDGTYVAGQCVGVSEAQCDAIRIRFGVSTEFNKNMQTCELKDAQTQEKRDAVVKSITALGFFTATILTGGTVLVVASAGAAIALTETKNILQNRATSQGFEILNLINQCGCKTKCTTTTGVCNICNTCNSKNCDVNAIYEAIPFTMVYADKEMGKLVDKSIKSIEDSCITNETERRNRINKLIDDMQPHKASKVVIDTFTVIANVTSLNPTSQTLQAIKGMKLAKNVKQLGTVVNEGKVMKSTTAGGKAMDVTIDSYTVSGLEGVQSDSTPTKR